MYKLAVPMALALISVVFLGSGITGFAVSETCCTGDNCPADEQCHIGDGERQETGTVSVLLSAGFLILSVLSYVLLSKVGKRYH